MAMALLAFKRPLDGALEMHRRGYKVFPLQENGKRPAFEGWQDWALNATEKKIEDYGTANPLSNWGVYCGPSGLCVIDIDTKDGHNGAKSLKRLQDQYGQLPETTTVETPSGGYHLYYEGETKSVNGQLGDGLDVKSRGGYVVAPGSRIGNKAYEIVNDIPTVKLPPWVSKLLDEKKAPIQLQDGQLVKSGTRNQTLAQLAGVMRRSGLGAKAIEAALVVANDEQLDDPLPMEEVKAIAASIARYKPEHAGAASDFLAVPAGQMAKSGDQLEIAKIPKRDWIMDKRFVGGFISVIVSPGGVGKSLLTMLDAAAVATGMPLTGFKVQKAGPVWLYNTEDPLDEIDRRLAALSIYHGLPPKDLKDIKYTSGRDAPLILAKADKNGLTINTAAIDAAVTYIKENKIVLLIADPFVRTHEVQENDNMHIDKVAWCFQRIADRTGCAIALVHHTSKAGSNSGADMNSARGASSLVNAARIAHVLASMTEADADAFGIPEARRPWFMRLDNAKANLQAPAMRADWFEKVSVTLPNTDDVGTLQTAGLVDITKEKEQDIIDMACRDLAMCMSDILKPDQELSIIDVKEHVLTHPKYGHLMGGIASDRRCKERVITLLRHGCQTNNKKFEYVFDEDRRSKHWVRCSKVQIPAADDFLR